MAFGQLQRREFITLLGSAALLAIPQPLVEEAGGVFRAGMGALPQYATGARRVPNLASLNNCRTARADCPNVSAHGQGTCAQARGKNNSHQPARIKLSIADAVAAILMIPTALSAQPEGSTR